MVQCQNERLQHKNREGMDCNLKRKAPFRYIRLLSSLDEVDEAVFDDMIADWSLRQWPIMSGA